MFIFDTNPTIIRRTVHVAAEDEERCNEPHQLYLADTLVGMIYEFEHPDANR